MAQFFGAPPMALLTAGAGALLLAGPVIGLDAALDADRVLWSLGTVLGLVAALLVLAMIYGRLVHHDAPTGAMVSTVRIGLGALGQSMTALGALAAAAPNTLPALYAKGAEVVALLGGVVVWGFALLWPALATGLTARTIRTGLPFAPTWWSFIFPVGAPVTATSTLAARTGSDLFVRPAVVFYALLVAAWAVVTGHSLRHAAGHSRRRLVEPHLPLDSATSTRAEQLR